MKTFLVTGGAGFIGSHLCDYILNKKQKVIALDNLLTGSLDNIKHNFSNEKFSFINHDVCNYLDIDEKINYILHFVYTYLAICSSLVKTVWTLVLKAYISDITSIQLKPS